ncbi:MULTISPECIES: hypothetical protein [unclassified Streptomyces]|nr:hypothetical protein [Streptomyces sp. NBC_01750]WSD36135.1 hypothetical protein OG966_32060 [Streptomyces sp. NBC_01750]
MSQGPLGGGGRYLTVDPQLTQPPIEQVLGRVVARGYAGSYLEVA